MTSTAVSNKRTALYILKNDLRMHDNPTLVRATQYCDELLIVYCKQPLLGEHDATRYDANFAEESLFFNQNFHDMGDARKSFIEESLADLDTSLQEHGNKILVLDTTTTSSSDTKATTSAQLLTDLINEAHITDVFISNSNDYDFIQGVTKLLQDQQDINLHQVSSSTLFSAMPTEALPPIFSQFRKKVEYKNNLLEQEDDVITAEIPKTIPHIPHLLEQWQKYWYSSCEPSKEIAANKTPFIGGETAALKHLEEYFTSDAPEFYKETRNALQLSEAWLETTRFSPWLANGSLSAKTLLNRLRIYEKEVVTNKSTYWIWFELLWREYFYWYAEHHGQRLFYASGIKEQPRASKRKERPIPYTEQKLSAKDSLKFEAWKAGETNYPIINACMKQLKVTGYMSNRGRQLVASCFIHELALDWRFGARYFEQQLIDYDVGSNWGNWQYLAGVGADPRGCRQFNLNKQTQQYDPNNEFINTWSTL